MTRLLCWLVFPGVLTLLSVGTGLVIERAAAVRLPRVLIVPVGFAGLCVVANLATATAATAELAVPAAVGIAVLGLGLSPPRHLRLRLWPGAAAAAVYLLFLGPVLASGSPSFAGYIQLDDTASWLAMTDHMLEQGRSLDGIEPSTHEATLGSYVATGAPAGAFLPLGVAAPLVGQDIAFVYQPYIAFLAALLVLALHSLASRLIASEPLRAAVAFLGAQPALFYGYSLWGGVKEIASGALLALVVALVPGTIYNARSARATIPLAAACAAEIGAVTLGGGVWLVAPLVVTLIGALLLLGRSAVLTAVGFTASLLVFSLPTVVVAATFVSRVTENDVLTSREELGNLVEPLNPLQVLGIWPIGDFRFDPSDETLTWVLLAVLVTALAAGLAYAARARTWEIPLYGAAAAVGLALVLPFGSPWVDAKALTTAAPAAVFLGAVGVAAVFQSGRRVEAAVAGVAIVAGVGWSNMLAYRTVSLSPHSHHEELAEIGAVFAGEGPALMVDYEPYGARHFLRKLDAEGAGELRRRTVPLRSGGVVQKGGFADIDSFELDAILVYRTLVLRRSPVASRPPATYERVWVGEHYEVWQRSELAQPAIVEHLPAGNAFAASAELGCSDVTALARLEDVRSVAAVERVPAQVFVLSAFPRPPEWTELEAGSISPASSGTLTARVHLPRDGVYSFWVGGSAAGRLDIVVDGRRVGSVRHRLNWRGQWTPFGSLELKAGEHTVELRHELETLAPGSRVRGFPLGPLAVSTSDSDAPVTRVQPSQARRFCGAIVDWVAALREPVGAGG